MTSQLRLWRICRPRSFCLRLPPSLGDHPVRRLATLRFKPKEQTVLEGARVVNVDDIPTVLPLDKAIAPEHDWATWKKLWREYDQFLRGDRFQVNEAIKLRLEKNNFDEASCLLRIATKYSNGDVVVLWNNVMEYVFKQGWFIKGIKLFNEVHILHILAGLRKFIRLTWW